MPFKRILKVLAGLLLTALLLITGIQLSFKFYFNEKFKKDLQEQVSNQTNNEYILQIRDLQIDIFHPSIYISDVELMPNKKFQLRPPVYIFSAQKINLVDFNPISFLLKKRLNVGKMELINSSGVIYRAKEYKTNNVKTDSTIHFSIYKLFQKHIHALAIENIAVKNIDFKVYDDLNDSIPSINSKDNELLISKLKINQAIDNSDRIFMAEKVNVTVNNFAYTTKDSLYTLSIKKLAASYIDSSLYFDSLQLIPNYSKAGFAKAFGSQTDRISITTKEIHFNKMDVKLFFERNWFIAANMNIESLKINAYRDKNDIRKPSRPKSVQQILKEIPFYTAIDTIHLNNSEITYEEVASGSKQPGKVFFNNVNGTIRGFTSDSLLFSKYAVMLVNAKCKFMNSAELTASYSFPLNTDLMVFSCKGRLNKMPMSALNQILEQNANISMKDGVIDSMVFAFDAKENESKGKMKFAYHDLKVELLNKDTKKSRIVENVLSFLAQRLIIKDNNPTGKNALRETDINYSRDKSRFIFNYSWKSLLSGIKPAIGLPESLGKKNKQNEK